MSVKDLTRKTILPLLIILSLTGFGCGLIPNFIFSPTPTTTQAPTPTPKPMTWMKTFGGTEDDRSCSAQPTLDGGYIILATTKSFGAGGEDIWLIKIDSEGNKTWEQTFGGSEDDSCSSIQPTLDGGYIILGSTYSYGAGEEDIWLIQTDPNGNQIWDKTFGGKFNENGVDIQQTTDGGFIIAGSKPSSSGSRAGWLIRTDPKGHILWEKIFEGEKGRQDFHSIQQTIDGGYILTGSIPGDGLDIWMVKTDTKGNKVWENSFSVLGDGGGMSVQQTIDEGYIIVGVSNLYYPRSEPPADVVMIKTDKAGNEIWRSTFGGYLHDFAYAVQQTHDGGYVFTGFTGWEGMGSTNNLWLVKANQEGERTWETSFSDKGLATAVAVHQTPESGYFIAGTTNVYGAGGADVWVIKTDPEGNVQ